MVYVSYKQGEGMLKSRSKIIRITLIAGAVTVILAGAVGIPLFPPQRVKPEWVYNAGERIISPPLAVGSLVMLQTTKSVRALDVSTGALRWEAEGPVDPNFYLVEPYGGVMRSANGLLLTAKGGAPILALSIQTGRVVWQERPETTFDESVTDMQVSSDGVYVARYNSYLSAFDLRNGTLAWASRVPSRTQPQIFLMNDRVVLVAGNSLEIFDATWGTMLAEHTLDGLVDAAVLKGSILYLALFNGPYSFEALNLESAMYLWRISREASESSMLSDISSITAEDKTLYASGLLLIAISAEDGQMLWATNPDGPLGVGVAQAGRVYARGYRFVYGYDLKTGKETSSLPIPQPLLSLHAIFPPPDLALIDNKFMVAEGNSLMVFSIAGQ